MEVVEKKKGLVPKLRFSDYSEGWKKEPFVKKTKFINGRAYKQAELLNEGKYKVLRVGNLFSKSDWYYSDLELDDDKYVEDNDLMYAWSASFGPHYWKGPKTIYHYHIWKVIPEASTDKDFLYQAFLTDLERIKAQSQGGTMFHITKGNIESREFAFPTLPEQQKIAAFLSAVDEKIQQLRQKKALLEKYKKGVMQKLFPKKAGEAPELRFTQPNGSNYPDWQEKKLGEVGKTFNGLTGKTKENFGKGEPYIQYMQIFSSSKIKPEEFGLVEINPGENQNKANYGDVFFTTSSETPKEIGTASVYMETETKAYLNSFCFGYRPNDVEILTAGYSQFLFRSESFRRNVIPLAQGSTRYNISKVELMKVSIPLPSKEEQQKIADFLSGIDQKINQVETQINQTQTFKKGLLQQMFV